MSTRQADLCIGHDNGHMMSPFVPGSCQVGDTVRLMIDYGAADRVEYGSYDRDDGVSIPTVEVRVRELIMLGDWQ